MFEGQARLVVIPQLFVGSRWEENNWFGDKNGEKGGGG